MKVTLDGGGIDFPIFIDATDVNNDGCLDILIVNFNGKSISVFFGYGNGNFQTRITSLTGGALTPMQMSFGDFNNDSLVDIVVGYRVYKFGVMFGFSNGTFADRKKFAANQTTSAIVTSVGDFNNDGHQDILATEKASGVMTLLLNRNQCNSTLI